MQDVADFLDLLVSHSGLASLSVIPAQYGQEPER